jgi:hypothetical protein
LFSFAAEEEAYSIYNASIITNDLNSTYIEGEVSNADGQEILVRKGFKTVAVHKMPITNAKSTFRVKLPADAIKDEGPSIFYVRAAGGESNTKTSATRVEVEYVEKEKQEINVGKEKVSMTYPGLEESLAAKATSGESLMYISEDPSVVKVDKKGKLIPTGNGDTKITVKQIGNERYEGAEKTVDVSVEAIDAYTVTYHSSADTDETKKQIVPLDSEQKLEACEFTNGDHRFLGWATEDGGLVKYKDAENVEQLAQKGENTDLYAVWTGDGAVAAVAWAIEIANDDSFTYGDKPAANAIGCYFCGTNCGPVKHNKPKGYEKTYVCLTFVGAAYAHGAEDPEILWADQHGKMPMYETDDNFRKFSCWTKIGKCRNLSIDDLEPGDVVILWSDGNDNNGHTWMYAGGDQIVESTGGGWGAGSIALKEGAAKRLAEYGSSSQNYVMRYTR